MPDAEPTAVPTLPHPQAPTIVEEPEAVPVDADGDHDRFAHVVKKDDQMKGYVMGESVTALCGKVWVPTRDPERYPICPTCKEILASIRNAGSN
jgi:hypothetical protein